MWTITAIMASIPDLTFLYDYVLPVFLIIVVLFIIRLALWVLKYFKGDEEE